MKFLFTGNYLPDYNRTNILKNGLIKLGHQIIEYPFTKKNNITKKELLSLSTNCDIIFLPCFTHKEVAFVKKNIPNIPLIFDPLISRYMTKIYDYKLSYKWSFSALRNFYRDKIPLNLADFIITDTMEHKKYFHKKFHIPNEKMEPLYIGNDFDQFYPQKNNQKNSTFTVGFYGGFIPLQGIMNILKAIELMQEEKIQFELIGNGFEYKKAKSYIKKHQLKNIHLPGWLSTKDLSDRINKFDIALGIFGEGIKTEIVIPNKVYHYASCGLPIITKDTKAIRELFINKKDIYLVDGSPYSIKNAILDLKSNSLLRNQIGENILSKMKSNWSEIKVAEAFIKIIKKNFNS